MDRSCETQPQVVENLNKLKIHTALNTKPTLGECAVLAGKALSVNMLEVNCFQTRTVTQPFASQHKAHMREMVNYFLIDVAPVYRSCMTWTLALNATMGMKRI